MKPTVEAIRLNDNWHALMYWLHQAIGMTRQNGAGFDSFSALPPCFPEATKAKRFPGPQLNVVCLFDACVVSPLVKSISGDEAPLLPKACFE
jgi:hypothetical protein